MQPNSSVKALTILSFNLASVVTTILTAQSFVPDFSAEYRLTNDYTGQNKALDMINDGIRQPRIHMVDLGSYAGQFWRFTERAPGKYYLWTRWYGPGKCLDVINEKGVASTSVHLADKEDRGGQYWTLSPWGDGSWRLTNDFTGPDKHLDVYSDNREGFLGTGAYDGQHWRVTKI